MQLNDYIVKLIVQKIDETGTGKITCMVSASSEAEARATVYKLYKVEKLVSIKKK